MRTDAAPMIRLEDYRPSDWLIDTVHLDIRLDPTATRVRALLSLRPNPDGRQGAPLVLDGDELSLVSVSMDGEALAPDRYDLTPQALTLPAPPPRPFSLTLETEINPEANSKLMGLYRSNGIYCTQCEADGFRRICYFLDRPDILSIYTTRIEADRATCPVLLGNGNPLGHGEVPDSTRHYAVWQDPWPKPAYLFALVAGDLGHVSDSFTTASGRTVALGVHVERGKEARAGYALDALKRAMAWDERVFGREYDLDVFNVVAVSDFNMGAMENKGLNIFNDKYVLASPETATDADYLNIEGIIAHEYFHNWTGNRITCRDWFQLCLKEGLTVYRDQEFTADERSRPVKRISDVVRLRLTQFVEDAGPLAHNVRPRAYREINNFYTATVYEKGAELIRLLKVMIGDEAFAAGMALYFERCDGTAATIEQFIACFAETSRRDLSDFARWYEQAGTPVVMVSGHHDAQARTYRLDLAQTTPPTPGQPEKQAVPIPIRLGLLGSTGDLIVRASGDLTLTGDVLLLDRPQGSVTFHDVPERPVPSLLRGFSAPVRLQMELSDDDLFTLAGADRDPVNRWQAFRTVATRHVRAAIAAWQAGERNYRFDPRLAARVTEALGRQDDEPAYRALAIGLPTLADMAREIGENVDPDAIHAALSALASQIGAAATPALRAVRSALADAPYSPDAASAGRRSLRNAALMLLRHGAGDEGEQEAAAQFDQATNMTDRLAALQALCLKPGAARERALERFEHDHGADALVLDKWFAVQASLPERATLARVRALMAHRGFSLRTPNRVYALLSAFAHANPTEFHRPDGEGHAFIAEMVGQLDRLNPQVAARLISAFRTWRTLEPGRRSLAEAALRDILALPGLSRDVADIAERALA